ncbi:hypothetical protein C8R48DRAFT_678291 [Suillus tomentosus]|nr:hypothetical protein C8R48DRAFT_678291 [Suillus tomentosus]
MVYCTSTARQENWLHFNGQALDTDAKSTHHAGRLIVKRITFIIPVACALQLCFSELEGYAEGINIEKFYGRACVPAVYYPRRGITKGPQPYCHILCLPIHDVNIIQSICEHRRREKRTWADQVGFIYGLAIEIELRRLYPKSFKLDDLHNNSLRR